MTTTTAATRINHSTGNLRRYPLLHTRVGGDPVGQERVRPARRCVAGGAELIPFLPLPAWLLGGRPWTTGDEPSIRGSQRSDRHTCNNSTAKMSYTIAGRVIKVSRGVDDALSIVRKC